MLERTPYKDLLLKFTETNERHNFSACFIQVFCSVSEFLVSFNIVVCFLTDIN